MMILTRIAIAMLAGALPMVIATPSRADIATDAASGQKILQQHCFRCHGQGGEEEAGLNVLNREVLVEDNYFVWPGKPDESVLIQQVEADQMPKGKGKLDAEQKAILRRWVAAGLPFPEDEPARGPADEAPGRPAARPFVSRAKVFRAVRDDLLATDGDDRRFRRYLTLTHLHNLDSVPDGDLVIARVAVSKLLNSLSKKPRLVVPEPIDAHETVLRFDLRDVGWDRRNLWNEVVARYPYGLDLSGDRDRELAELAGEVELLTGDGILDAGLPVIRADWLVTSAALPELYHIILEIPGTARELEGQEGVEVESNIREGRGGIEIARAAFPQSGVSNNNRMVERHETALGSYWKSYDFRDNNGRANLVAYPLGPRFNGNPNDALAFEHAGGELIYTLPNGLQAYMLVDADGKRIDVGPIEIVFDRNRAAGGAEIRNGLSCMACHRLGMIGLPADVVRNGAAVRGDVRRRVEELYIDRGRMKELIDEDSRRFVEALEAAGRPFLGPGQTVASLKTNGEEVEPVSYLARSYFAEVGLEQAAAELGLEDPARLAGAIQANDTLGRLLGPLASGGKIKRAQWDDRPERARSLYQITAAALDLGAPRNPDLRLNRRDSAAGR